MNKKGQIEMADLVGFLLIFITIIVFGFVFIFLSPKAKIEAHFEEDESLAKKGLIDFLSYVVMDDELNTADKIILDIQNEDFDYTEKVSTILFAGIRYYLVIHKNREFLFFNTNMYEVENVRDSNEANINILLKDYMFDSYSTSFENYHDDFIEIRFYLFYDERFYYWPEWEKALGVEF